MQPNTEPALTIPDDAEALALPVYETPEDTTQRDVALENAVIARRLRLLGAISTAPNGMPVQTGPQNIGFAK